MPLTRFFDRNCYLREFLLYLRRLIADSKCIAAGRGNQKALCLAPVSATECSQCIVVLQKIYDIFDVRSLPGPAKRKIAYADDRNIEHTAR